jgi:muramidase (phage lysozyme)
MKKSVKIEIEFLIKELDINCTVEEFKDIVDCRSISVYQILSEEFMRELKHEVSWYDISKNQNLSEDFIREFQDKVNWRWISIHQKLSEGFIREFKNKVDWLWISQYQKLSEDFIREFKDEVWWNYISKYQKLSEEFIREFQEKVNWEWISRYQKLSKNFIRKFKLKIDPDNWLYKDKKFKLKKIKNTGLYEFIDADHILAYKGIKSDRYSKFNFQYQYLKGGTYECHCDCTSSENSFGLSAWTEEKARKHCGELVIKVKINVADIGRIVHDGGKLRCSKFTVID